MNMVKKITGKRKWLLTFSIILFDSFKCPAGNLSGWNERGYAAQ